MTNSKYFTSLIAFTALLAPGLVHAAMPATAPGISLSGEVFASDSHIDYKILESFPASVSISDIENAFSDVKLKVNFSSYLIDATEKSLADGKYQVVSTGRIKEFGISITKKVGAICSEVKTADTWTQTCNAETDFESTGMLLKQSQVTISCGKDTEARIECSIHSVVSPKGVNYLVVVRSAQDLCFSSTKESLNVLGGLYEYIINGQDVDSAKTAFNNDLKSWDDGLDALWAQSHNGDLEGQNITLKANETIGFTHDTAE